LYEGLLREQHLHRAMFFGSEINIDASLHSTFRRADDSDSSPPDNEGDQRIGGTSPSPSEISSPECDWPQPEQLSRISSPPDFWGRYGLGAHSNKSSYLGGVNASAKMESSPCSRATSPTTNSGMPSFGIKSEGYFASDASSLPPCGEWPGEADYAPPAKRVKLSCGGKGLSGGVVSTDTQFPYGARAVGVLDRAAPKVGTLVPRTSWPEAALTVPATRSSPGPCPGLSNESDSDASSEHGRRSPTLPLPPLILPETLVMPVNRQIRGMPRPPYEIATRMAPSPMTQAVQQSLPHNNIAQTSYSLSAILAGDESEPEPEPTPPPKKPKRRQRRFEQRKKVGVACINCVKAKAGCDCGRPCKRCVRKGLTNCVDRPVNNTKRKRTKLVRSRKRKRARPTPTPTVLGTQPAGRIVMEGMMNNSFLAQQTAPQWIPPPPMNVATPSNQFGIAPGLPATLVQNSIAPVTVLNEMTGKRLELPMPTISGLSCPVTQYLS